MARYKDVNWNLYGNDGDKLVDNVNIKIALMMDIRDRLDRVLRVLECSNTADIPCILRRIARNTAKKRRKTKKP